MKDMSQTVRSTAMWCHLSALAWIPATFIGLPIPFISFIVPLIIWSNKKQEHPFIDENGKESLNFQISLTIYMTVFVILVVAAAVVFAIVGGISANGDAFPAIMTMLIGLFTVGAVFLVLIVGLIQFVLTVIAAVKANKGETYRYPLTIRFLK